ncbi:MAG: 50S ribosomal protein L29 [Planctomycetota bacterium]|jgi:large subunit ribosomal protein L29
MIREEVLAMSRDDLQKHLLEKQDELMNLRFQKALQQLEGPHKIRIVRREIAQIKTLLKEYEFGRREERTE